MLQMPTFPNWRVFELALIWAASAMDVSVYHRQATTTGALGRSLSQPRQRGSSPQRPSAVAMKVALLFQSVV